MGTSPGDSTARKSNFRNGRTPQIQFQFIGSPFWQESISATTELAVHYETDELALHSIPHFAYEFLKNVFKEHDSHHLALTHHA